MCNRRTTTYQQKLYGDKQNIINAYMESLTRATPPTYEISSLRTFYETYQSSIRSLVCNSNTMGCHRIDIQSAESQLDSILTKFWETNQIPNKRNQGDSVMKTFQKTIKFNDTSGRYSVALPWKENKNDLPSKLNLSVK